MKVNKIPDHELHNFNASYLSKQVLIGFEDSNQTTFKIGERVKLNLFIKNVPTLYIKIFEFNSVNYFKKTKTQFKTDIDLDGLTATKEYTFEFDEPPQRKFTKIFEFEHLDDRVGIFIIEFIGNGFSSRATIQKGALSLIHKSTIAGQLAYIVDENRQICANDGSGIWYNDTFFKADLEYGGRILIPYEKYISSGQAILVHNEFAHLQNFTRLSEEYSFDASFILHPESIIMGNDATILIRPKLELNKRRWDLKLIENLQIILTTISYVDNIPITKFFENLNVNENNEIAVEFQVPPNLQSVSVSINCSVKNITKGYSEHFTKNKLYNLITNTTNAKYWEAYLRRYKGDYYYYALGKNGEPLRNVLVKFKILHSVHTSVNASFSLSTNFEGKVDLGPLTEVAQIISSFPSEYGNCSRSWNIKQLEELHNYPNSIEVLEDEQIEIPVDWKVLSPSNFSLYKVWAGSMNTIENWYDKLSLNWEDDQISGTLSINGLSKGVYKAGKFYTPHLPKSINFSVMINIK